MAKDLITDLDQSGTIVDKQGVFEDRLCFAGGRRPQLKETVGGHTVTGGLQCDRLGRSWKKQDSDLYEIKKNPASCEGKQGFLYW